MDQTQIEQRLTTDDGRLIAVILQDNLKGCTVEYIMDVRRRFHPIQVNWDARHFPRT